MAFVDPSGLTEEEQRLRDEEEIRRKKKAAQDAADAAAANNVQYGPPAPVEAPIAAPAPVQQFAQSLGGPAPDAGPQYAPAAPVPDWSALAADYDNQQAEEARQQEADRVRVADEINRQLQSDAASVPDQPPPDQFQQAEQNREVQPPVQSQDLESAVALKLQDAPIPEKQPDSVQLEQAVARFPTPKDEPPPIPDHSQQLALDEEYSTGYDEQKVTDAINNWITQNRGSLEDTAHLIPETKTVRFYPNLGISTVGVPADNEDDLAEMDKLLQSNLTAASLTTPRMVQGEMTTILQQQQQLLEQKQQADDIISSLQGPNAGFMNKGLSNTFYLMAKIQQLQGTPVDMSQPATKTLQWFSTVMETYMGLPASIQSLDDLVTGITKADADRTQQLQVMQQEDPQMIDPIAQEGRLALLGSGPSQINVTGPAIDAKVRRLTDGNALEGLDKVGRGSYFLEQYLRAAASAPAQETMAPYRAVLKQVYGIDLPPAEAARIYQDEHTFDVSLGPVPLDPMSAEVIRQTNIAPEQLYQAAQRVRSTYFDHAFTDIIKTSPGLAALGPEDIKARLQHMSLPGQMIPTERLVDIMKQEQSLQARKDWLRDAISPTDQVELDQMEATIESSKQNYALQLYLQSNPVPQALIPDAPAILGMHIPGPIHALWSAGQSLTNLADRKLPGSPFDMLAHGAASAGQGALEGFNYAWSTAWGGAMDFMNTGTIFGKTAADLGGDSPLDSPYTKFLSMLPPPAVVDDALSHLPVVGPTFDKRAALRDAMAERSFEERKDIFNGTGFSMLGYYNDNKEWDRLTSLVKTGAPVPKIINEYANPLAELLAPNVVGLFIDPMTIATRGFPLLKDASMLWRNPTLGRMLGRVVESDDVLALGKVGRDLGDFERGQHGVLVSSLMRDHGLTREDAIRALASNRVLPNMAEGTHALYDQNGIGKQIWNFARRYVVDIPFTEHPKPLVNPLSQQEANTWLSLLTQWGSHPDEAAKMSILYNEMHAGAAGANQVYGAVASQEFSQDALGVSFSNTRNNKDFFQRMGWSMRSVVRAQSSELADRVTSTLQWLFNHDGAAAFPENFAGRASIHNLPDMILEARSLSHSYRDGLLSAAEADNKAMEFAEKWGLKAKAGDKVSVRTSEIIHSLADGEFDTDMLANMKKWGEHSVSRPGELPFEQMPDGSGAGYASATGSKWRDQTTMNREVLGMVQQGIQDGIYRDMPSGGFGFNRRFFPLASAWENTVARVNPFARFQFSAKFSIASMEASTKNLLVEWNRNKKWDLITPTSKGIENMLPTTPARIREIGKMWGVRDIASKTPAEILDEMSIMVNTAPKLSPKVQMVGSFARNMQPGLQTADEFLLGGVRNLTSMAYLGTSRFVIRNVLGNWFASTINGFPISDTQANIARLIKASSQEGDFYSGTKEAIIRELKRAGIPEEMISGNRGSGFSGAYQDTISRYREATRDRNFLHRAGGDLPSFVKNPGQWALGLVKFGLDSRPFSRAMEEDAAIRIMAAAMPEAFAINRITQATFASEIADVVRAVGPQIIPQPLVDELMLAARSGDPLGPTRVLDNWRRGIISNTVQQADLSPDTYSLLSHAQERGSLNIIDEALADPTLSTQEVIARINTARAAARHQASQMAREAQMWGGNMMVPAIDDNIMGTFLENVHAGQSRGMTHQEAVIHARNILKDNLERSFMSEGGIVELLDHSDLAGRADFPFRSTYDVQALALDIMRDPDSFRETRIAEMLRDAMSPSDQAKFAGDINLAAQQILGARISENPFTLVQHVILQSFGGVTDIPVTANPHIARTGARMFGRNITGSLEPAGRFPIPEDLTNTATQILGNHPVVSDTYRAGSAHDLWIGLSPDNQARVNIGDWPDLTGPDKVAASRWLRRKQELSLLGLAGVGLANPQEVMSHLRGDDQQDDQTEHKPGSKLGMLLGVGILGAVAGPHLLGYGAKLATRNAGRIVGESDHYRLDVNAVRDVASLSDHGVFGRAYPLVQMAPEIGHPEYAEAMVFHKAMDLLTKHDPGITRDIVAALGNSYVSFIAGQIDLPTMLARGKAGLPETSDAYRALTRVEEDAHLFSGDGPKLNTLELPAGFDIHNPTAQQIALLPPEYRTTVQAPDLARTTNIGTPNDQIRVLPEERVIPTTGTDLIHAQEPAQGVMHQIVPAEPTLLSREHLNIPAIQRDYQGVTYGTQGKAFLFPQAGHLIEAPVADWNPFQTLQNRPNGTGIYGTDVPNSVNHAVAQLTNAFSPNEMDALMHVWRGVKHEASYVTTDWDEVRNHPFTRLADVPESLPAHQLEALRSVGIYNPSTTPGQIGAVNPQTFHAVMQQYQQNLVRNVFPDLPVLMRDPTTKVQSIINLPEHTASWFRYQIMQNINQLAERGADGSRILSHDDWQEIGQVASTQLANAMDRERLTPGSEMFGLYSQGSEHWTKLFDPLFESGAIVRVNGGTSIMIRPNIFQGLMGKMEEYIRSQSHSTENLTQLYRGARVSWQTGLDASGVPLPRKRDAGRILFNTDGNYQVAQQRVSNSMSLSEANLDGRAEEPDIEDIAGAATGVRSSTGVNVAVDSMNDPILKRDVGFHQWAPGTQLPDPLPLRDENPNLGGLQAGNTLPNQVAETTGVGQDRVIRPDQLNLTSEGHQPRFTTDMYQQGPMADPATYAAFDGRLALHEAFQVTASTDTTPFRAVTPRASHQPYLPGTQQGAMIENRNALIRKAEQGLVRDGNVPADNLIRAANQKPVVQALQAQEVMLDKWMAAEESMSHSADIRDMLADATYQLEAHLQTQGKTLRRSGQTTSELVHELSEAFYSTRTEATPGRFKREGQKLWTSGKSVATVASKATGIPAEKVMAPLLLAPAQKHALYQTYLKMGFKGDVARDLSSNTLPVLVRHPHAGPVRNGSAWLEHLQSAFPSWEQINTTTKKPYLFSDYSSFPEWGNIRTAFYDKVGSQDNEAIKQWRIAEKKYWHALAQTESSGLLRAVLDYNLADTAYNNLRRGMAKRAYSSELDELNIIRQEYLDRYKELADPQTRMVDSGGVAGDDVQTLGGSWLAQQPLNASNTYYNAPRYISEATSLNNIKDILRQLGPAATDPDRAAMQLTTMKQAESALQAQRAALESANESGRYQMWLEAGADPEQEHQIYTTVRQHQIDQIDDLLGQLDSWLTPEDRQILDTTRMKQAPAQADTLAYPPAQWRKSGPLDFDPEAAYAASLGTTVTELAKRGELSPRQQEAAAAKDAAAGRSYNQERDGIDVPGKPQATPGKPWSGERNTSQPRMGITLGIPLPRDSSQRDAWSRIVNHTLNNDLAVPGTVLELDSGHRLYVNGTDKLIELSPSGEVLGHHELDYIHSVKVVASRQVNSPMTGVHGWTPIDPEPGHILADETRLRALSGNYIMVSGSLYRDNGPFERATKVPDELVQHIRHETLMFGPPNASVRGDVGKHVLSVPTQNGPRYEISEEVYFRSPSVSGLDDKFVPSTGQDNIGVRIYPRTTNEASRISGQLTATLQAAGIELIAPQMTESDARLAARRSRNQLGVDIADTGTGQEFVPRDLQEGQPGMSVVDGRPPSDGLPKLNTAGGWEPTHQGSLVYAQPDMPDVGPSLPALSYEQPLYDQQLLAQHLRNQPARQPKAASDAAALAFRNTKIPGVLRLLREGNLTAGQAQTFYRQLAGWVGIPDEWTGNKTIDEVRAVVAHRMAGLSSDALAHVRGVSSNELQEALTAHAEGIASRMAAIHQQYEAIRNPLPDVWAVDRYIQQFRGLTPDVQASLEQQYGRRKVKAFTLDPKKAQGKRSLARGTQMQLTGGQAPTGGGGLFSRGVKKPMPLGAVENLGLRSTTDRVSSLTLLDYFRQKYGKNITAADISGDIFAIERGEAQQIEAVLAGQLDADTLRPHFDTTASHRAEVAGQKPIEKPIQKPMSAAEVAAEWALEDSKELDMSWETPEQRTWREHIMSLSPAEQEKIHQATLDDYINQVETPQVIGPGQHFDESQQHVGHAPVLDNPAPRKELASDSIDLPDDQIASRRQVVQYLRGKYGRNLTGEQLLSEPFDFNETELEQMVTLVNTNHGYSNFPDTIMLTRTPDASVGKRVTVGHFVDPTADEKYFTSRDIHNGVMNAEATSAIPVESAAHSPAVPAAASGVPAEPVSAVPALTQPEPLSAAPVASGGFTPEQLAAIRARTGIVPGSGAQLGNEVALVLEGPISPVTGLPVMGQGPSGPPAVPVANAGNVPIVPGRRYATPGGYKPVHSLDALGRWEQAFHQAMDERDLVGAKRLIDGYAPLNHAAIRNGNRDEAANIYRNATARWTREGGALIPTAAQQTQQQVNNYLAAVASQGNVPAAQALLASANQVANAATASQAHALAATVGPMGQSLFPHTPFESASIPTGVIHAPSVAAPGSTAADGIADQIVAEYHAGMVANAYKARATGSIDPHQYSDRQASYRELLSAVLKHSRSTADDHLQAMRVGKRMADHVLHNYANVNDFDGLLSAVFPWHIWTSRTAAKYAEQALTNPRPFTYVARGSQYLDQQDGSENMPPELRGKVNSRVRLPLPGAIKDRLPKSQFFTNVRGMVFPDTSLGFGDNELNYEQPNGDLYAGSQNRYNTLGSAVMALQQYTGGMSPILNYMANRENIFYTGDFAAYQDEHGHDSFALPPFVQKFSRLIALYGDGVGKSVGPIPLTQIQHRDIEAAKYIATGHMFDGSWTPRETQQAYLDLENVWSNNSSWLGILGRVKVSGKAQEALNDAEKMAAMGSDGLGAWSGMGVTSVLDGQLARSTFLAHMSPEEQTRFLAGHFGQKVADSWVYNMGDGITVDKDKDGKPIKRALSDDALRKLVFDKTLEKVLGNPLTAEKFIAKMKNMDSTLFDDLGLPDDGGSKDEVQHRKDMFYTLINFANPQARSLQSFATNDFLTDMSQFKTKELTSQLDKHTGLVGGDAIARDQINRDYYDKTRPAHEADLRQQLKDRYGVDVTIAPNIDSFEEFYGGTILNMVQPERFMNQDGLIDYSARTTAKQILLSMIPPSQKAPVSAWLARNESPVEAARDFVDKQLDPLKKGIYGTYALPPGDEKEATIAKIQAQYAFPEPWSVVEGLQKQHPEWSKPFIVAHLAGVDPEAAVIADMGSSDAQLKEYVSAQTHLGHFATLQDYMDAESAEKVEKLKQGLIPRVALSNGVIVDSGTPWVDQKGVRHEPTRNVDQYLAALDFKSFITGETNKAKPESRGLAWNHVYESDPKALDYELFFGGGPVAREVLADIQKNSAAVDAGFAQIADKTKGTNPAPGWAALANQQTVNREKLHALRDPAGYTTALTKARPDITNTSHVPTYQPAEPPTTTTGVNLNDLSQYPQERPNFDSGKQVADSAGTITNGYHISVKEPTPAQPNGGTKAVVWFNEYTPSVSETKGVSTKTSTGTTARAAYQPTPRAASYVAGQYPDGRYSVLDAHGNSRVLPFRMDDDPGEAVKALVSQNRIPEQRDNFHSVADAVMNMYGFGEFPDQQDNADFQAVRWDRFSHEWPEVAAYVAKAQQAYPVATETSNRSIRWGLQQQVVHRLVDEIRMKEGQPALFHAPPMVKPIVAPDVTSLPDRLTNTLVDHNTDFRTIRDVVIGAYGFPNLGNTVANQGLPLEDRAYLSVESWHKFLSTHPNEAKLVEQAEKDYHGVTTDRAKVVLDLLNGLQGSSATALQGYQARPVDKQTGARLATTQTRTQYIYPNGRYVPNTAAKTEQQLLLDIGRGIEPLNTRKPVEPQDPMEKAREEAVRELRANPLGRSPSRRLFSRR